MVEVFKPKYGIPIFEQNSWKWCNDKLIMVTVWFTRTQLPTTVLKRSLKVKVAKNHRYLSDSN